MHFSQLTKTLLAIRKIELRGSNDESLFGTKAVVRTKHKYDQRKTSSENIMNNHAFQVTTGYAFLSREVYN